MRRIQSIMLCLAMAACATVAPHLTPEAAWERAAYLELARRVLLAAGGQSGWLDMTIAVNQTMAEWAVEQHFGQ